MDNVVVVGAGLGGITAAKALRCQGFVGSLAVIGDETHDAYDRPPLSKHVLLGAADRVPLAVDWAELGVQPRFGEAARGLAQEGLGWRVRLASGDEVSGDRVVVATGARPVTASGLDAHPNVFTLRTLDDAHALRSALRRKIDVVVLGAGWIGAEVASSAAEIGCVVRVVEPQAAPVWRSLGQAVGRHLVPWYAEAGVELLLGRRVVGASEREVELNDGSRLPADVVVVGAGVAPSTQWLTASPVELDPRGGIVVDEFLESVSARGVYALGDCASYPSRRYGTRLRPEHWTNAKQAGQTVAANVLGGRTSHDPVPYFWSKQFGRMLQYSGHHDAAGELVFRGDPADRRWSACWLRDGQPTAILAVNRPRDVIDARRLLAGAARFDVSLLTDPETPLAECVIG
jgi:3-phenylpropionate/trans-cinnamate dioxygenase ferredoxin reductase subunit